jgi:hypothetical protein
MIHAIHIDVATPERIQVHLDMGDCIPSMGIVMLESTVQKGGAAVANALVNEMQVCIKRAEYYRTHPKEREHWTGPPMERKEPA